MPVRLAHRTSDVLLSHGHLDHSEGLLWLIRARIGVRSPCRVVGPPGTARRLFALLAAFTWDRIGDDAPRFEVAELHGRALRRWALAAGAKRPERLPDRPATDGVVRREADLAVRAVRLDHGIPVLAFALEEARVLTVRSDRLERRGLPPGPWLAELKRRVAGRDPAAPVPLPDGSTATAGELARDLLLERPGQKLVYATDVADTPTNRAALVGLARGAHLLVLEAAFAAEHAERARTTGHLTVAACAEIAAAAGVERLVPFHLSSRYQQRPETVLAEIAAASDRLWLPTDLLERVRGEGTPA